jgi:DNA-binding LacI/PurR family transcriptional regulator/biotin operon repressor
MAREKNVATFAGRAQNGTEFMKNSGRSPHAPRLTSPVEQAGGKFAELLASAGAGRLPSERQLAREWGISQAAVNRAAQRLIASGVLQRKGYRLLPGEVREVRSSISVAVLTHRSHRYPMLEPLAASLGLRTTELYYVGRDTLRSQLRKVIGSGADAVVMGMTDGGWEWDAEAAALAAARIPLIVGEPAPADHAMVAEDWGGAGAMAVERLVAAGHREIVFLGSLRRAHRSNIVEKAYVETCLRLGLGTSARRILRFTSHYSDTITATSAFLRSYDPPPTACILYDADHLVNVVEGLARARLRVPEDLSLAVVGDHPAAIQQNPPVTCAAFNTKALTRLVLAEVALLVEEARSAVPVLSVPRIKLEPVWRDRGSVRHSGGQLASDPDALMKNTTSKVWATDPRQRRREVEITNARPHSLAQAAPESAFRPVSLADYANRSISRQNGWLGHAPLSCFSAGRRVIHGVPFEILDERTNDGRAAIVLLPQHSETHSFTIPLDARVRAVYVLHGCGFVGADIPFGWYDFILKNGRTHTVPLVARGLGPPSGSGHEANIQDWWNDFPQIEGPGHRHFVVTESDDSFAYERYLYTLEWSNPTPRREIRSMRISINPSLRTVLGVLGITLLCD